MSSTIRSTEVTLILKYKSADCTVCSYKLKFDPQFNTRPVLITVKKKTWSAFPAEVSGFLLSNYRFLCFWNASRAQKVPYIRLELQHRGGAKGFLPTAWLLWYHIWMQVKASLCGTCTCYVNEGHASIPLRHPSGDFMQACPLVDDHVTLGTASFEFLRIDPSGKKKSQNHLLSIHTCVRLPSKGRYDPERKSLQFLFQIFLLFTAPNALGFPLIYFPTHRPFYHTMQYLHFALEEGIEPLRDSLQMKGSGARCEE